MKSDFKLTKSQEVLREKMDKFLNGPDRIFLLTGKPGVGKTTMTKVVLDELIQSDIESGASGPNINVAGITLAHKAKNVLGEHIPNVFTFASAYGMKEKIHDDGTRSFQYDKYSEHFKVGDASIPVFVHDEVSQYTNEMLKIVFERTSAFSKVILMGDKAQLPPIQTEDDDSKRDADSPVFELELSEGCKHELTERVRQAEGNPILELSDVIREEIFGSQNIDRILDIIQKPNIVDGVGYDFIAYDKLNEHIKRENQLNTCLIAFRNASVNWFNEDIRNYLLDNPDKSIIEGDLICMTDNFSREIPSKGVSYKLYNSDVYKLGKVEVIKTRLRTTKKNYYVESYLAKIIDEKSRFPKELIVPTEEGMKKYEEILKEVSELCKKRELKWDEFWALKNNYFCSCYYGYCITAYKSQGSTYDDVYLDINDVLLTRPLTPKRKLQTIYTAITRARYMVYFLKSNI